MALKIIYTSKKVKDDLIPKLDENKYFQLDNHSCSRKDLFNFALALGISAGFPSELQGKNDLFRNETIGTDRHLYNAVYFDQKLDGNENRIDEILSDENVFPIVEKYAESGFSRIADAHRNKNDYTFTLELIKEMNEIYNDFKEDYTEL